MRESWAVNLRAKGLSFRWIRHQPRKPAKTAMKLDPCGIVVLLNDHHLHELTEHLLQVGGHGRGKDERVWLGLSTEAVVNSPFPDSEKKTRDCAKLCHLVAHFDLLADQLIRQEGAEALFQHQYVDHLTFRSRVSYQNKKAKFFWSGKLPWGNVPGEYSRRKQIFQRMCGHVGWEWREAGKPDLPVEKIVRELDSYQGLINLPSNCPGYTAGFFERMAMGAVVLQYRSETPLPEGLEPGRHFIDYDPDRPEELVARLEEVLKDPGQFSRMASEGQRACLARHTLQHRLQAIFRRLHKLQPTPWLESLVEKLESH
jgi:hypothetical protein